ncbi:unnamed protein product [Somion occarium]|uniref:Uncharacterized protein n=1 Tax=Somion occarium TaxID=3059160 RepID=A0ABP1CSL8_9APHY
MQPGPIPVLKSVRRAFKFRSLAQERRHLPLGSLPSLEHTRPRFLELCMTLIRTPIRILFRDLLSGLEETEGMPRMIQLGELISGIGSFWILSHCTVRLF